MEKKFFTEKISCTNCYACDWCYTHLTRYSPPDYKCHQLKDNYVKVNKTHVRYKKKYPIGEDLPF